MNIPESVINGFLANQQVPESSDEDQEGASQKINDAQMGILWKVIILISITESLLSQSSHLSPSLHIYIITSSSNILILFWGCLSS